MSDGISTAAFSNIPGTMCSAPAVLGPGEPMLLLDHPCKGTNAGDLTFLRPSAEDIKKYVLHASHGRPSAEESARGKTAAAAAAGAAGGAAAGAAGDLLLVKNQARVLSMKLQLPPHRRCCGDSGSTSSAGRCRLHQLRGCRWQPCCCCSGFLLLLTTGLNFH